MFQVGNKSEARVNSTNALPFTPKSIVPKQLKELGVSNIQGFVEDPLPILLKNQLGKEPGDTITPPVIFKQY